MKKNNNKRIIIGLVVLLFVLIIRGLIGSSKAEEIGTTCDFGLGENGDVFCWKWHQNILGDIGDIIREDNT